MKPYKNILTTNLHHFSLTSTKSKVAENNIPTDYRIKLIIYLFLHLGVFILGISSVFSQEKALLDSIISSNSNKSNSEIIEILCKDSHSFLKHNANLSVLISKKPLKLLKKLKPRRNYQKHTCRLVNRFTTTKKQKKLYNMQIVHFF